MTMIKEKKKKQEVRFQKERENDKEREEKEKEKEKENAMKYLQRKESKVGKKRVFIKGKSLKDFPQELTTQEIDGLFKLERISI